MKIFISYFFLIIIVANNLFAQIQNTKNAQGLFLTIGVGPRFPIGELADQQTIGAGFDIMLSYTDSELAPVFFYGNLSYQNHPGDYEYYKKTDLSSLSTSIFSFHGGTRYYFHPLVEDVILLMPILEGGFSYSYIEKFNQYKIDTGKSDKLQNISKFGFHIGGGLSFF